jgi:macrolide transport system ATP-binding/permease protein
MIGFVNQIYVQAVDQTSIQMAISQSTDILARRHRIGPGTINEFSVRNLSQIAEMAEGSSRIMALLLAAVASISLVVGGIGIMNKVGFGAKVTQRLKLNRRSDLLRQ